jgi:hypothetical protein
MLQIEVHFMAYFVWKTSHFWRHDALISIQYKLQVIKSHMNQNSEFSFTSETKHMSQQMDTTSPSCIHAFYAKNA